ncbi:MAG: TM0106 family RecB-like putative nuclease [Thermoleophilia bacterium]|nr:TM0106 family RecB-like putative nuclease [Thermoleophilia bacterium]
MPLEPRPSRGTLAAFTRAREQARVQLEGRVTRKPVHELLAREEGQGLARLPEPSPGDIFFDIEGDAFVGEAGLEYLFGFAVLDPGAADLPPYERQWAFGPEAERDAFEWFVDVVMARWQQHPDLHIYHFAPYEPSAVKRLMGRYATREEEVDRMLRAGLFVDLYAVVRQALRASVEHYSIKDLEVFYGYVREVPLTEASLFLRGMERALELDRAADVKPEALAVVEAYNCDDCVSTLRLRDWLEGLRAGLVDAGEEIGRPQPSSGEPSEKVDERQQRVAALEEALAGDVPFDRSERTPEQHARWLLAQMLDWHRREAKSTWWEYFRLRDLPAEELLYEKGALSGLEFAQSVGGTKACPIHRYRYPFQEAEIRADAMLHTADGYFGVVTAIDPVGQTVDVKKASATRDSHPEAAFAHSFVSADILAESLLRLGEWVRDHGVDAPGPYRAARDLLLAHPPRLVAGAALHEDGEDTLAAARRLAPELDSGILPIQGPPGAGKTYAAARMICTLVKAGKKVGITAVSHKVIRRPGRLRRRGGPRRERRHHVCATGECEVRQRV